MREVRERFSTIGKSMFGLFEIMTLEGWTDYVRPFLNNGKPFWVFFFLFFIFVAALFLLNLVTAVVVEKTMQAQEDQDQSGESREKEVRIEAIRGVVDFLRQMNKG